jgi:DNA ligase-1
MRLADLVEVSDQVGATRSRLEKVDRLAALIRRFPPPLVMVGVSYVSGELPAGRLGLGYAALRDLRRADTPPARDAALALDEVERVFSEIKAARGPGAAGRRSALLGGLLARATEAERHFLVRLIIGELRQGAQEGVVVEAVARAFAAPAADVRRATMLAGSLPVVAAALAHEGPAALARFDLQLFQPVQPMLADAADDVNAAWERLGAGAMALDFKLDGARVQVHKDGARVEVYSRLLNRVTPAVPEIVELVSQLPSNRLILDGEAIALSAAGRPLPFQTTMRRFGRRLDVDHLRAELPLDVRFFDVLRVDEQVLLDEPLQQRWRALSDAVARPAPAVGNAAGALVPHIVATTPAEAEGFLARALAEGHEGVMAKSLTAPYSAGRRGQEWLKIKSAHTFDLMVLAAEWGSGRRRGWLSNLHLGARDPDQGAWVMLGKTFKGMTDEVLRWQTEALLAREIGRDGHAVFVRPELVAEIAFNGVQASPQYPGGVALRFARLVRYRPDKGPADTNTISEVRALLPPA